MREIASKTDIFSDVHYKVFHRRVKLLIGIDLDDYRSEQMARRLGVIMVRSGAANLTEYARMLDSDAQRLKEFSDYLTINVSEFFRDPDRFAYLRKSVLPALLNQRRRLSIWSAGCSIGAEAYSVAMLLEDLSPRGGHRLLATDVDEKILSKARMGRHYREQDVRNVPPLMLRNYFVQQGDLFAVSDTIRRYPAFRKHNLLADAFDQGFDLVLCRNVAIYFTSEAKTRLHANLSNTLRPGGILFIGATEIINNASQLGLESVWPSFYRRLK